MASCPFSVPAATRLAQTPTPPPILITEASSTVAAAPGSPQSANRYVAVLFPAFLILGHIRSEVARAILSFALILTLAFTTHLFVNGYWAG